MRRGERRDPGDAAFDLTKFVCVTVLRYESISLNTHVVVKNVSDCPTRSDSDTVVSLALLLEVKTPPSSLLVDPLSGHLFASEI